MKSQPIVIVGGGFAGLRAALDLDRRWGHFLDTPIFLIDPSPYHIYTPSLYEVASAHSPRVVVIPFEDILAQTHIHFIEERVTHIDLETKVVGTENRQLPYSDLVLTLGSQTKPLGDDRADPEDIFAVKTIDDVLAIRDHLEHCCREAKAAPKELEHRRFIVAGAGPTGVEFTASLVQFLRREARYHHLPPKAVKVILVDSAARILPRLDPILARLAHRWLTRQGVLIRLGTKISWADHERIRLNREVIPTETLIWTAGVTPHSLFHRIKGLRHDDHGRVLTDAGLQAIDQPRVWVAGDGAAVPDSGLALAALAHGRHVARSIVAVREGEIPPAYQARRWPAIVPLSGRYGLARFGETLIEGIWVIWLKRLIDLAYYLSILPLPLAWRVWRGRGLVSRKGGVFCIEPYSLRP